MKIIARPMVVMFDIETTGLNPYENQVVLISMKRKGEMKRWKLWETEPKWKLWLRY